MSGHYPFYHCCNINRGARGAVRHCHFDNPKWLWQGGDQPRQAVAYLPASLEALRCHRWLPPTTPCSAADANLNTRHLCMTPYSAALPHLRANTASCHWEKTNFKQLPWPYILNSIHSLCKEVQDAFPGPDPLYAMISYRYQHVQTELFNATQKCVYLFFNYHCKFGIYWIVISHIWELTCQLRPK